ncbi:MAG TPA: hypothetical protein VI790_00635, partial [Candidatus Nanoarchaeia archaeon]|nr:hypothetical protein [Candidatus Nanoarchaeia archaeon]
GNGVIVDTGFKINYRPNNYSCRLSVCGDGVIDSSETEVNCCLDTGCSAGECAKTDFDSYKCVKRDTCGDGVINSYESSINCCLDAGCPNGLTCTNNECVSGANQACVSDSDCACFKGCGVINIDYGLSNPVCNDQSITCSRVLPVCSGGICKAKLVSLEDNEVIDYVSALKELRTRLFSFNEIIIDISSFLESAVDYYESNNNTVKASRLRELINKTINFNREYFLLIGEIDDAINSPSRASINYILNRVESFEGLLIDVSARILEATGDDL